MKKIIIAIDGHSSCGKSTFAKEIAKKMCYTFIDTGAMYRAVTLWALDNDAVNEPKQIVANLQNVNITFKFNAELERSEIYLNDRNIDSDIRNMLVSDNVSAVSAQPEVRTKLVALQQQMGVQKGIVMDGRDIGTTVFPSAELKIFMTASVDIRAQRRFDELTAKGEKVDIEHIKKNIEERDFADENRAQSPLRKADDALVLDNTAMTVDEQMQWVDNIIKEIIK